MPSAAEGPTFDGFFGRLSLLRAELSDGVAGEKIFHFIEQVLINKTDLIMTYGQQLRQEAIQRDRLAIARTMLTKGYDPHEVKTLIGISQEAISKIKPTKKQS